MNRQEALTAYPNHIASIPYASDGKFRVRKAIVIGEVQ